ncbi:MAG TPA: TolC family protein [Candidatus Omnitrophota bacterium]|nr:TolC family protein [Candidatus Omnitrophota bacterium]HPS20893.1 TolC family protein [Candidatus Omnitrophota bacterium]
MENILKKCVSAFLIGILLFPSIVFGAAGDADTVILTSIDDAVKMAYAANRDIKKQEKDLAAAKAALGFATSEFLPKLNLKGSYVHNEAIMTMPTAIANTETKDIGTYLGYIDDNTWGFRVDQTVFNGGKNIAQYKEAQINIKIQEESLRAKKLDVEMETKRLYYGLLLAYETRQIAEDFLGQSKSHHKEVNDKFGEGTASRFELLQSKVHVSNVTPQLVRAENAIDLIGAELKKLLSIDMNKNIKITDELEYSVEILNEKMFLEEAYLKRPELIVKKLQMDAGKQDIAVARSGALPQVGASFDYSYRGNDIATMFEPRKRDWYFGLSVSVPIFDGFAAASKINEARARYERSGVEHEDLYAQVALDIRRACLDIVESESIIVALKDGINEAEEALAIANVSYKNGVVTNLDVLDSEVALSQIKKNYSESVYDHLMAKAFLDRSIGKSIFDEKGTK